MPIQRGRTTSGTRSNLIQGLRSRPMNEAAVDAVVEQAARFTELLVDAYDLNIARGEVGIGGTAQASDAQILSSHPPNALIYGRIQSGKTAGMVLTSALAFDNGFRVVIVLTADNVELVRQTANRFRDLEGPWVLSSLKEDATAEWRAPDWEANEEDFLREIADAGLVFVCAKNAFHLPQVLDFLARIDAAAYPALIVDDEADAATPDHTLQARTAGRANAPQYPSTINRRIIENTRPGEEGQSAREVLPHHVFVQVTASPFVLFLQRAGSRLRPTTTFVLEPGDGYCGGEQFFGAFDPQSDAPPDPPLVLVPPRENQLLARRAIPAGLAASVEFVFVSTAVRALLGTGWPTEGYKHLSHTSPNLDQHEVVAGHIERHLRTLRTELRTDEEAARARFTSAHQELLRTVPNAPPMSAIVPVLAGIVGHSQISRVNADSHPTFGPRVTFLVGGNILGRGLTIDDLLVTYYLRQAQVSQMDTVLQHARMYGYRQELMPYTRVFVPHRIATTFSEIHQSEQTLRGIARRLDAGEDVPVRVARGTRATRPGALETTALRVYDGGIDQIAPRSVIADRDLAMTVRELLVDNLVPLNAERQQRATRVPLAVMKELVALLEPVDGDGGRWDVAAVLGLIDLYAEQYNGEGIVYVRPFEQNPSTDRTRARLSGIEIGIVRSALPTAPVLVLIYWESESEPALWFPTLVVPANMPTYVFSPS